MEMRSSYKKSLFSPNPPPDEPKLHPQTLIYPTPSPLAPHPIASHQSFHPIIHSLSTKALSIGLALPLPLPLAAVMLVRPPNQPTLKVK